MECCVQWTEKISASRNRSLDNNPVQFLMRYQHWRQNALLIQNLKDFITLRLLNC